MQLVGLAVLATAGAAHPRLVLAVYIPLIVIATAGAALFMDNLTHVRNEEGAMREVARDRHAWIISFLYIGTFGSFIGFGFAFGQVLQVQFGETFDTPMRVVGLTFLGPLLGSLFRPVGGTLADRFGGSRVTTIVFAAMAAAAALVLAASLIDSLGAVRRRLRRHLRPQRARQRLDVQDDPGDLPGQGGARRRRRRRRRRGRPPGPPARPGR